MMRSLEWSYEDRASAVGIAGRERGSALVVTLLTIAVLSLLTVMGTRSAQTELQITQNEVRTKQALSAAEAGLTHAYGLVKSSTKLGNELASGGTGGLLAGLGSAATLSGQNYRFRAFGGGSGDGYFVRAEDDYDETLVNDPTVDKNGRIYLIARGRVGGAERVVTATVSGVSRFPNAVFGVHSVKFSGGAILDSYDSTAGPYNPLTRNSNGNLGSDGDIDLTGTPTTVYGDVTAHGTVAPGTSTITGTTTNSAPLVSPPPVSPCAPYSSGAGIVGGSYNSSTGNLTVTGGIVTLTPGTYCFNNVTLKAGALLTVAGAVSIYANGPVDLGGGSVANTTQLAANLQIYSAYNGSSDAKGVNLNGGALAYMAIYAPTTGVTINGSSSLFGAIVGYDIKSTGGAQIHYDESLAGIMLSIGPLTGWHEVRD